MTKVICYDTEFIEDGRTIDLISIGLVDRNGQEYYAVSSEFSQEKLFENKWLVDNVWPTLPTRTVRGGRSGRRSFVELDLFDPDVKDRATIAREVAEFCLADGPDPELWAWYSAYDHVALCQLFGRMVPDLPAGMPMFTNDLRHSLAQLERHLGRRVNVPDQVKGEHNALEDARHNWVIKRHLERVTVARGWTL
jgi:3' exoribonuclease, RNase T-like